MPLWLDSSCANDNRIPFASGNFCRIGKAGRLLAHPCTCFTRHAHRSAHRTMDLHRTRIALIEEALALKRWMENAPSRALRRPLPNNPRRSRTRDGREDADEEDRAPKTELSAAKSRGAARGPKVEPPLSSTPRSPPPSPQIQSWLWASRRLWGIRFFFVLSRQCCRMPRTNFE